MIKVGILTYHRAKNYGAFLQAYGLCGRLNEESDIEAEIIDFCMLKESKRYRLSRNPIYILKNYPSWTFERKMYKSFEKSYKEAPFSPRFCNSDDMEIFRKFVEDKYDIIVVGSDEVWKLNSFRGFPNPYWLPNFDCKKMSYAASSRSYFIEESKETQCEIKKYLEDFEFITVRDTITYNQIKKIGNFNDKLEIMPDPSFIYDYKVDSTRGRKILNERLGIKKNEKVAIVMTESDWLVNIILNELQQEYRLVSVYEYKKGLLNLPNLTPFEWIDVLSCADLVLASYFHAICFSIVNNKSFLAFGTKAKKDKLTELLESMNLLNYFVEISPNLKNKGELKKKIEECNKNKYNSTQDIILQRKRMNVFINKLRIVGENK